MKTLFVLMKYFNQYFRWRHRNRNEKNHYPGITGKLMIEFQKQSNYDHF